MDKKILKYENPGDAEKYLELVCRKYSRKSAYRYYISDLVKALEYTNDNPNQETIFIQFGKNNELCAHCGLTFDERFKKGEAQFGFFECENNINTFYDLWDELKSIAGQRGINRVFGPVNGTIWHQYRIVKNFKQNYASFISEPLTEPYYYSFFDKLNPVNEINYYSGRREHLEGIKRATKPSYISLINNGYSFELINKTSYKDIDTIFEISKRIFKDSWGYIELNEEEFLNLYNRSKIDEFISGIYVARFNSVVKGFCSVIADKKQYIIKTIGVIPEFQGEGIGNALVYKIHYDAVEDNAEEMIYALVRKGNKVKYFPKDDVEIIREYATFVYEM